MTLHNLLSAGASGTDLLLGLTVVEEESMLGKKFPTRLFPDSESEATAGPARVAAAAATGVATGKWRKARDGLVLSQPEGWKSSLMF